MMKPDEEEVKRGYEKYLEWKGRQEEKERDRDPEEITDPLYHSKIRCSERGGTISIWSSTVASIRAVS